MMLLIRADAGATIGTGHVMRCLALAQEWRQHRGAVTLLTAPGAPAIAERARAEGIDVIESADGGVRATAAAAARIHARWVVVDGYTFSGQFTSDLRTNGCRVLQLDDYGHVGRVTADVLLNQNIYASEAMYPERAPHARILLGPEYVLLRLEFRSRDRVEPTAARARRVLVTLGGSDPENATARVLRACAALPHEDLDVLAVVGGANPHVGMLRERAERDTRIRLRVNADDMPALMQWADIAVLSGGSTCWEAAFMGLPFVVIVLTEHQNGVADGLERAGVARSLGPLESLTEAGLGGALTHLLDDADERVARSARGRALIDGRGAERVRRAMELVES